MSELIQNLARDASAWLEAHVYASSELAVVGLVCVVFFGLFVLVSVLRRLGRLTEKFSGFYTSSRARKVDVAGYKILLGRLGNKRRWRKRLKHVLVGELGEFLFSSNFVLLDTPHLPHNDEETARQRLARSNADIVVWGELTDDKPKNFVLKCLRRTGGGAELKTSLITSVVPASGAFWRQEAGWSLISYLVANGVQPILATPSAFRRDKVQGLVQKLQDIISSDILEGVEPSLKAKIEDEFCAGALHISDQDAHDDFADSVIALRRKNLSESDALSSDRIIQIKMELGRALLRKSDKKYDNGDVAEAMGHLGDAINFMRRHPRIKLAQEANEQLARAKGLLENRRRFSLNFG